MSKSLVGIGDCGMSTEVKDKGRENLWEKGGGKRRKKGKKREEVRKKRRKRETFLT